MNQSYISKEGWISKLDALRGSTERILNLSPDWRASNGWDLKDLMIHLTAWDEEYLSILRSQIHKESYIPRFCRFSDYKKEEQMKFVNRWNNQILNDKRHLSFEKIRKYFIKTRQRVFREFGGIWSDDRGLSNDFALQISDLSAHDAEHIAKGIK
ncbi:MAG: hypothetical protein ACFFB2_04680 [Promethearchaeota archaeon]